MTASQFQFTGRARPVVEVGSGASSTASSTGARWDVSLWDDVGFAEWAGSEPTWSDASLWAQTADTEVVRRDDGRVTDQFDMGQGIIVFDNTSGWANPGHVPADGEPTLTVGQQIRVGVEHQVHGLVWKARGFIDAIEPRFAADGSPTVSVRYNDALGESGRARIARTVPEADDEPASDRLENILDAVPWTTAKRDITTVATELVEATLDGRVSDLLRRCAESAGGWVFGDTDGNVVFRSPGWLNDEASRAPDFVITNDPAITGPNVLCASTVTRPIRRQDLAGRVILQTPPGDPETYESSTVIDDYGAETYERRDLWTASPVDRETIADRILLTRSPDTLPRVESVTIYVHAAGDPTSRVDFATLVDPARPTRVRCRHLDDEGGVVFDDQCFVIRVRHHISPDGWTVELSLDRSDPFAISTGPALWDDAEWNQAQWS